MRVGKSILVSLILWLCLVAQVWAAGVLVRADRDNIRVGDDFRLEFSASEPMTATPDFSPLKADFQIVGTSTSTNVQYINGQMSQQTSWLVTLYANRAGTLQIPAINFGNLSSDPLTIQVLEQGANQQNAANTPPDIVVELSADSMEPYVQQQVIITQRLLHSVPLLPTRASMSHPELEKGKGLIQQLGTAKNGSITRNGVRYQVIERRYAVFPQVSGELTLGRTVFQGALDDRRSRQIDPFGIGGQQVRRFSEPLVLKVQPQVAGTKQWLPATSLTLNAHWEPANKTLKAGEPVTLTLAIIADGLMAEQLPSLDVKPPQGIKAYANQPVFSNDLGGKSVIGMREEKWVLMGTADGEYVLPEITIDWWDLKAKKMQTARLDAVPLKVTGVGNAPAVFQSNPTAPLNQSQPAESNENLLTSNENLVPSSKATESKPFQLANWTWWLVAGVCSLLALIAFVVWWLKRSTQIETKVAAKTQQIAPVQAIKLACQANDPQAAFQALHEWIREDLQLSPPTVASLRAKADLPLKQALDDLSTVLYASIAHVWDGQDLWAAVQTYQLKPNIAPSMNVQGLADLYPN